MANPILPYINPDAYYRIESKDLENLHFKLSQSHSIISMFSDWVVDGRCELRPESQTKVISICYLLLDLLDEAHKVLPEV